MKKEKHYLGFVRIAIFAYVLTACSPIYYAPNAHNVPLLKEKHETRLNLGMTATEDLVGPDIQAAYAVGKNVGIIANGTYLKGGNENSNWDGHGFQTEVGAGYFKLIGGFCVAEIYGGAGFAKVTNQHYEEPISLNFIKPFIQPSFGFNSNYFEIAFTPKIAWAHYKAPFILNYEVLIDANGNAIYNATNEKQTFFILEPGITIRGGWKYTKLQLQAIQSFQDIPNAQQFSVNLGLALTLAPRFRKVAE